MDVVSLCPLPAIGFVWQPYSGVYAQTVVVNKPKADVVLVGHAYAPAKQPARSWMTRLVVGELDKSIEVWCDRAIRWQDGTLLEGPRVTTVPLVWERAAGGPETSNPVGMRFDAAPDRYGTVPVPNLQPPGMFVSSRADTFTPCVLDRSHWSGRGRRRGSGDWRQDGKGAHSLSNLIMGIFRSLRRVNRSPGYERTSGSSWRTCTRSTRGS
jgi:hypothetical protein